MENETENKIYNHNHVTIWLNNFTPIINIEKQVYSVSPKKSIDNWNLNKSMDEEDEQYSSTFQTFLIIIIGNVWNVKLKCHFASFLLNPF